MKRNERIKAPGIMLVVLLIVSMLAACSSGNNGSNNAKGEASPSSQASATASTEETPKEVEITVWDKPAPDASTKAITEEMQAKFDEAYPNIKVKHEDGTQSKEKFMAAVAGGEQPTVFGVAFPDMAVYIRSGIVADITNFINNSSEKANFIDGAFDMGTADGKIYGVPNNMYTTGLYYNKELLANAGITTPPATWDEFAEAAKAVQEANAGTTGFDILGMDWADWHFEYYVWQAGGDLTALQPDGTVKLRFTEEATVKALQYYKDLKWKHKVVQSNVLQSLEENSADFYTGKTAMILGASDSYGGFVSKGMDPNVIGFAPYPVGPAGVGPSQAGGQFWTISPTATPEQQEAAFQYITFMTSKEYFEEVLQFRKDNGLGMNPLSVRKDVEIAKYMDGLPADFVTGIQKAAQNQQLEYYLKSQLSPYIVKPIQKILLDENADSLAELQAAEQLAQKEVIDKYNQEILSGAK